MVFRRAGLCDLPVELLYSLQLYALSHALPHVSWRLYRVYKSAPSSFHAEYILGRVLENSPRTSHVITKALRFPLCTTEVLDALCRHRKCQTHRHPPPRTEAPDLPRRLFRRLTPRREGRLGEWTERDHPLPFLEHLYARPSIRTPDANAHEGYALTRAVHAGFLPLVRFLLRHGADPGCKGALAVKVAIRRKDLGLLRVLIERDGGCEAGKGKKRRVEDRMGVSADMLRVAVECDARDIVVYLTQEKGCVPDMQTLHML